MAITPAEDFTLEVRTVLTAPGSVTSVNVSGGSTGLVFTGGPVTTTGTITMSSGTLVVGNGGTGTGTAFTQGSAVFAGAAGVYSQDNANFFWDNTNKRLGVGTATPSGTATGGLHILNTGAGTTVASNIVLRLQTTAGGRDGSIQFSDSVATAYLSMLSGDLALTTGGSQRVTVQAGGNVGIQTTTPQSVLNVGGGVGTAAGATDKGHLIIESGQTDAATNGLEWKASTSGSGFGYRMATIYDGAANIDLRIQSRQSSAAWTPRLSILGVNGNVGIGTTTPAQKLSVAGTIEITSGSGGVLKFADGTTQITAAAGGGAIGGAGAAGQATFFTAAATVSGDNAFWWDNTNKRLGLGTTTPSERLHVANTGAGANVTATIEGGASGAAYSRLILKAGTHDWRLFNYPVAASGFPSDVLAVYDGTASQFRAVFDANGNFGVATTQPGSRFTVAGNSNTNAALAVTATGPNGVYVPEAFGTAAPDVLANNGGNMTAASGTLTLTGGGASFSASDVGKTICVVGAGAAGAVLKTTISGYTSPTQVSLTATASTTVVVASVYWGTDSTAAFQAMFAATPPNVNGPVRYQLRPGAYLITDECVVNAGQPCVYGAGKSATIIYFMPTAATKACFKTTTTNENFTFADFMLIGPYAAASGSMGIYAHAQTYYGCRIDNVWIQGLDKGILFDAATTDCVISNFHILEAGTYGIAGTGASPIGLSMRGGLIFAYARPATVGVTNASASITGAPGTFYQQQIGQRIAIQGAGPAGVDLVTTITAVTSTSAATIGTTASTTASKSALICPNMSAGMYLEYGSFYSHDFDVVGGAKNLWLNPGNGQQVYTSFLSMVTLDSAWGDGGLVLTPTGTGTVNTLEATNSWFSSANGGGIGATGQQVGLYINGTSATACNLIQFVGCQFLNSNKGGAIVNGVTGIDFVGCKFDGNGITANTYDALYLGTNVSRASITNSRFGHLYYTTGTTDRYGINATAGVTGLLNINGNSFSQYGTGAYVNATALGGTNLNISNNVY